MALLIDEFKEQQEKIRADYGVSIAATSGITPYQAAERVKQARRFGVSPDEVDSITPDQVTRQVLKEANLTYIQDNAPTLLRKLEDPSFANLILDDLENQSIIDRLIYKMTPHATAPGFLSGVGRGIFDLFYNANTRGGVGIINTARHELDNIQQTDEALAKGTKTVAELFGSEKDPTGEIDYAYYKWMHDKHIAYWKEQLKYGAERVRYEDYAHSQMPMDEAIIAAFSEENRKDWAKSASLMFSHPVATFFDVALPSIIQMLPALIATIFTRSPAAGMATMGTFSYLMDTGTQLREEMETAGVDFSDPQKLVAFISDPKNRKALEEAQSRTIKHGISVALFDALSMGVATRTLLPKALITRWAEAPIKRGLTNMAGQVSAGAVLGASGEAGGQLWAYGEIQSAADVIAEGIGEFAISPIEVLTSSIEISREVSAERQASRANAQRMNELTQRYKQAKLTELDRDSQIDYVRTAAKDAGVEKITISVDAFHQSGMDDLFNDRPEVQEQVRQADPVHGNVNIDMETFVDKVSQVSDEKRVDIINKAQIGDTPAQANMDTDIQIADDAAAKQLEDSRQVNEKAKTFKQELADVGREIGTQIRRAGESKEYATALQAIIQSYVGIIAQQTGVSPREIWNKYGANILGEPNVERNAAGEIVRVEGLSEEEQAALRKAKVKTEGSRGDFIPKLFDKGTGKGLIVRWRNAKKSTLLHETGHMFLEMRMQIFSDLLKANTDISKLPVQTRRFINTTQSVMDWFNIKSIDEWNNLSPEQKRAFHEQFAREFETYVYENKAPTEGLKNAFSAFKEFLRNVYYKIMGQSQNEQVVEMFDAMFLSDAQIREATIRQGLQPLFESQEASGMNNSEWEQYRQGQIALIREAQAEQTSRNAQTLRRFQRARKRVLTELRKKAKGRFAAVWQEEENNYNNSRVGKAQHNILNTKGEDGRPISRLYDEDVRALGFSEKQVNALHKAKIVNKQESLCQVPLDQLAPALGYANAVEMVQDLLDNVNPDDTIFNNCVERIEKENPELIDPDKMQQAAESAVFNNGKLRMLDSEIRAMRRMAKKVAGTTTEIAETMAHGIIGRMKFDDISPIQYIRAAARAAKESQLAWSEGRIDDAVAAKEREICLSAMAKEAKEAISVYVNNYRVFRTQFNEKKKDGVYTPALVVLQRALANLGFVEERRVGLNPAEKSFQEELRELQNDIGHEFEVSDDLLTDINRGDRSVLETPDRANELFMFLNELLQEGRNYENIRVDGKKRSAAIVQKEGADAIRENADTHGRTAEKLPLWKRYEVAGKYAAFRQALHTFGLNHARAAALIAVLDGSWDGTLSKLVIYSSDKAGNLKAKLKRTFARPLDKLLSPKYKELSSTERKTSQVFNRGNNNTFTIQEAFVLLLNYGNEGNRQRAIATMNHRLGYDIRGEFNPADSTSVQAANQRADDLMNAFFQEYLSADYFPLAQKIWDLFDKMKDETAKTAKRINGREPVWVQKRAFTVGGQELQGGYYPIVYDKNASLQGAQIAAINEVKDTTSIFASGGVSDGHLQSRVNKFDHPLTLTMRALGEGLNEQIQYVSFAEWVNDMRKVFKKDSEISQAILERYGAEYYKQITNWIKDIAAGDNGQLNPNNRIDKAARIVRQGVSLVGLGFNAGVAAVQLVGMTQSYVYNGAHWQNRGLMEVLRMGPMEAYRWACDHSDMMTDRMTTQFRELNEIYQRVNGVGPRRQKLMEWSMFPIAFVQMMVDLPTWHGAYQKALFEGKSETAAVEAADRAVTNSQGSGRPQDLSAFERGGAFAQLFTVFYSFFNMTLNLAQVERMNAKSISQAAGSLLMLCMIQPLIEYTSKEAVAALLGTGEDDKDEDLVSKHFWGGVGYVANFDLSLFFLIREMANMTDLFEGKQVNYSGPAGLRLFSELYKVSNAARQGATNDFSISVMRNMISGMGMILRIPTLPITRGLKGYQLHEEGKSDSFYSYISGR